MRSGLPSHVDLTTHDVEDSARFYDRVLGRLGYARPRALGKTPTWFLFDDDGSYFSLALQPARAGAGAGGHDRYAPGLHHLAFHVPTRSEVDAFHDFLVEIGAPVLDPPADYDYTPGYYAVFFADPDGMKLEVVYEPPAGSSEGGCPFCGARQEPAIAECPRCGLQPGGPG